MVVQRTVNWLTGRDVPEDDVPVCPDHGEPMALFKKVGKPARFSYQDTEQYELLFRCVVPGCDRTATRSRVRTQIPVPGEAPARPRWAIRRNKTI